MQTALAFTGTSTETIQPRHLDQVAEEFVKVRPRLLGVAYRVLRDRFEAEDTVQDAWLRWQRADREQVDNPQAFLVTTTTRLALNRAQSAWRRRETPVDEWRCELVDPFGGPELAAERREAVEAALLATLARLSASERAAYLLHEAFDYRYERIAELLGLQVAHCRQLVRRARKGLLTRRARPVSVTAHQRLVAAVLGAAQDGEFNRLEGLLAPSSPLAAGPRRI